MVETVDFRVRDFRSNEFNSANRFRGVHLDFVVGKVHEVLRTTEISDFHIEFLINEDVFGFDVAVRDSIAMKLFQSIDELVENQPSNPLVE